MVVLRQSGCFWAKTVVFGKNGCIRQKWSYFFIVVVLGQGGCIRVKRVVFYRSGCFQAKVVVFGQKLLHSNKEVVIRKKWQYSGKSGCDP